MTEDFKAAVGTIRDTINAMDKADLDELGDLVWRVDYQGMVLEHFANDEETSSALRKLYNDRDDAFTRRMNELIGTTSPTSDTVIGLKKQLDDALSENDDLKDQINELEDKVDDLESENEELTGIIKDFRLDGAVQ